MATRISALPEGYYRDVMAVASERGLKLLKGDYGAEASVIAGLADMLAALHGAVVPVNGKLRCLVGPAVSRSELIALVATSQTYRKAFTVHVVSNGVGFTLAEGEWNHTVPVSSLTSATVTLVEDATP